VPDSRISFLRRLAASSSFSNLDVIIIEIVMSIDGSIPVIPVQAAVLNRFSDMLRGDGFRAVKIRELLGCCGFEQPAWE
jgi:hypothetical protein